MVGAAGFELATPCTPCKCATRLRYAPNEFSIAELCMSRPAKVQEVWLSTPTSTVLPRKAARRSFLYNSG